MSKLTGHAHYALKRGETLKQYDLADESVPIAVFDLQPGGPWASRTEFESGDYVGAGTLAVANRRVVEDELSELRGTEWISVYGSNGYKNILFKRDADDRVPEIREMLEGLEQYPSLSDDELSHVEQEQQDEDWSSYGREELRRFLEGTAPDDTWREIFDSAPDALIDDLWWELVRDGDGSEMEIENQTTIFRFERALERVDPLEEFTQAAVKRLPTATREVLAKAFPSFVPQFTDFPDATIVRLASGHDALGRDDLFQVMNPEPLTSDAEKMAVLVDQLLATGGEWDEGAEKILRAKGLGRYAGMRQHSESESEDYQMGWDEAQANEADHKINGSDMRDDPELNQTEFIRGWNDWVRAHAP